MPLTASGGVAAGTAVRHTRVSPDFASGALRRTATATWAFASPGKLYPFHFYPFTLFTQKKLSPRPVDVAHVPKANPPDLPQGHVRRRSGSGGGGHTSEVGSHLTLHHI